MLCHGPITHFAQIDPLFIFPLPCHSVPLCQNCIIHYWVLKLWVSFFHLLFAEETRRSSLNLDWQVKRCSLGFKKGLITTFLESRSKRLKRSSTIQRASLRKQKMNLWGCSHLTFGPHLGFFQRNRGWTYFTASETSALVPPTMSRYRKQLDRHWSVMTITQLWICDHLSPKFVA